MDDNFLYSLLISSVVLVMAYGVCYRKIGLGKNSAIVISLAFALLTFRFLQTHPSILDDSVTRIALALVGGVIALTSMIGKNRQTKNDRE